MNLKKKWPWLAAIAFLAATVAILHHVLTEPDPVFKGKPLSAWFDLAARQEPGAKEVFKEVGPEAVPFLARELRRGDLLRDRIYSKAYPKFPGWLQKRFAPPREPHQVTAARLLSDIGPVAEPAYNDMLVAYNHAYLNQRHLPVHDHVNWEEQLTNPPTWIPASTLSQIWFVRRWLLVGFCHLPGAHKEVIPLLLSALHEPLQFDPSYLLNNTNLAASIRLDEPTLLSALTDPDASIRMSAANMLGTLAADHPECVEPLMKATQDPAANVSVTALEALKNAPMPFEKILLIANRGLQDADPRVRNQAMITLMKSSGGFRQLDLKLVAALDSHDPAVRAAAAFQLGRFGAKSKPAVPKLAQLTMETNEPDAHVREQAAAALAKIEGKR